MKREYVLRLTQAEAEVVNGALAQLAEQYAAGDLDYLPPRKQATEYAAVSRARAKLWNAGFIPRDSRTQTFTPEAGR